MSSSRSSLAREYNLHHDKPLPVLLALSASSLEPVFSALQDQVTALSPQITALLAQNERPRAASVTTGGALANKRGRYCHSHGEGGHDGSRCKKKFAGHNDAAALANHMGGTKGQWAVLTEAQKGAARNRTT